MWSTILGSIEILPGYIDSNTVNILQGRCPKLAEADLAVIKERRRDLLPYLSDQAERDKLWIRICSVDCVIPSIYTFLEDTKYLEPCARVMKELIKPEAKQSVHQTYKMRHNAQLKVPIEVSEGEFEHVICNSGTSSYHLAYVQIWLFAMRHFPTLTGHCPRKDVAHAKPWTSRGDSVIRWRLFLLATAAGFEAINPTVQTWDEACQREAEKVLAHFFPSSIYSLTAKEQYNIARKMNLQLSRYTPKMQKRKSQAPPESTTDAADSSCGSDVSFRCGVPFEQSFECDQAQLFLKCLHDAGSSIPTKQYLTSFAVKKDMIHSFFGELGNIAELSRTRDAPTSCSPTNGIERAQDLAVTEQPNVPTAMTGIQSPEASASTHKSSRKRARPVEAREAVTTPQSALVPYQESRPYDLNTRLHSEEAAYEIALNWYQNAEQDRLIIAHERERLYRVHRIAKDDLESYERIITAKAIFVPNRLKKLKTTSPKAALSEPGLFILDQTDSQGARETFERIWEVLSPGNKQRPRILLASHNGVEERDVADDGVL